MIFFYLSFASSLFNHQYEEKSFISWMRSTNQYYTGDEYHFRLGIFLANSHFIKEHNSKNMNFIVGLNKFAVYTPAEYKTLLGFRMPNFHNSPIKPSENKYNTDSVDWRDKGVVNEIRDQAECGSDWAFSVIQAAESANAISNGKLESYSEQNLVDCVSDCYGCDGGTMTTAFSYIISNQDGHFASRDEYKYKAFEGTCKFSQCTPIGSISNYINIAAGDEDDLASKIEEYGPVSAAMDASSTSFELYIGGIYDEPSCSSQYLDHAVGVVGFGKENITKYWIVRNSWGKSWGENGYIRMIWENNQCGIASMACVPLA